MKSKILIAMVLVSLFLLVGCTQTSFKAGENKTIIKEGNNRTIPLGVLNRYYELSEQYKYSLGATLQSCPAQDKNLFVVIGSGGFSGITYYYDLEGNILGSYEWDDMVEHDEPAPPFEIDYTKCII